MIDHSAGTRGTDTRDKIVATADSLFYQRGYESTSFADVAEAAGISRGNFYYHFPTKDEILDAVIDRRQAATRAMLKEWSGQGTHPRDRLLSFARLLVTNRPEIMAHGCPVGTLCTELAKLQHGAREAASEVFILFRNWLAAEFASMGCDDRSADEHALHLLMLSQGIASLATALREDAFIDRELAAIERWLETVESTVKPRS